jgi:hypothetical protein
MEADDAATADKLLADDAHNRRASLLNGAVRPLGIFSGAAFLAALNPFIMAGSAVDSAVTTAVNLWHYNRLSTPEREALARYTRQLEREPRTEQAPEIAEAIHRLGAKRAAAMCADTLEKGTDALDDRDLDRATFFVREAGGLDGCAERAEKPEKRLARALAEREALEDAGRWPIDDPPRAASDDERRDHEAVAVATALGDPGAMLDCGRGLPRAPPEEQPPPRDGAGVGAGTRPLRPPPRRAGRARRPGGRRRRVGRPYRAGHPRRRGVHAARRHTLRRAHAHARDGALRPPRPAERPQLPLRRRAAGRRGRPGRAVDRHLQRDGHRDAGVADVAEGPRLEPGDHRPREQFLAREPDSKDVPEVHGRLADAYERAEQYPRALMHYKLSKDPDADHVADLEGKVAEQLFAEAQKTNDGVLLAGIAEKFGSTEAGEKAKKILDEKGTPGELVLGRDLLLEHPDLLGPDALDLDPRLLDGDGDNGELADGGVTLAPGELRLALRDHGVVGRARRDADARAEPTRARRAARKEVSTRASSRPRRTRRRPVRALRALLRHRHAQIRAGGLLRLPRSSRRGSTES